MGEAKRRKAKLGADYGRKVPPLNTPNLREIHIEKLTKVFTEGVKEIAESPHLQAEDKSLELYLAKVEGKLEDRFRERLEAFLSVYEREDQEFLVTFVVTLLLDIYEVDSEDDEGTNCFLLHIVFNVAQPYLTGEFAEDVANFRKEIDDFFAEVIAEEKEEEANLIVD